MEQPIILQCNGIVGSGSLITTQTRSAEWKSVTVKSAEEYFEPLTVTEKQVLGLMAQGLSYQEIGKMTGKKVGTVKFHSAGIFRKLQVKNRQQAVNRANEIGLI